MASKTEQATALRWFGNQPRLIQLEAIKFQTDLLRQQRKTGVKITPEFALELLAEASRKMSYEEEKLKLKTRLTHEEAGKISERKIQRFRAKKQKRKSSPKREIIRVKFFHIVQILRQKEGFGWRNCAQYLGEFHGLNVTHTYLKTVIEDLEKLDAMTTKKTAENDSETAPVLVEL
jgi:hypothetical protein